MKIQFFAYLTIKSERGWDPTSQLAHTAGLIQTIYLVPLKVRLLNQIQLAAKFWDVIAEDRMLKIINDGIWNKIGLVLLEIKI